MLQMAAWLCESLTVTPVHVWLTFVRAWQLLLYTCDWPMQPAQHVNINEENTLLVSIFILLKCWYIMMILTWPNVFFVWNLYILLLFNMAQCVFCMKSLYVIILTCPNVKLFTVMNTKVARSILESTTSDSWSFSVDNQLKYAKSQLDKLKKTNVFNTTFHIWWAVCLSFVVLFHINVNENAENVT